MKRLFSTAFTIILLSLSLVGCSKPSIEGIILEVNEHGIKLATELSSEEYEEIENIPVSDIQNEDVQGNTYRGLIDLTYKDTGGLSKGDKVEVWIDGDIMESYPEKAKAKKISVKE
ncbi:DUF3221 domain-containing protein [Pseudogracilibacillus sp. ICA-222130]|uniref:DUF3221 domain-containing protein n=1 Tax=Pseudogracilibacillus sp. ICA-222130 TaxID=3134655 RepID=UPI0030BCBFA1